MGLFSSSKSAKTTNINETNIGAEDSAVATGRAVAAEESIVASNGGSVHMVDAGAVQAAFEFAESVQAGGNAPVLEAIRASDETGGERTMITMMIVVGVVAAVMVIKK